MNDAEILELTDLCNALADARLSEPQQRHLNGWLADSEEARRFYVRFAALNASLCDYAAELQTEQPAPPKPKLIRHPMAWWAGIGALAACLTAALLWPAQKPAPSPETAPSVAWLTGATNARWSEASGPQPGDALERGQRLHLQSGLAEVTFDSGARVVLEGPASLEVQSAWAAALQSGAITASAPSEAAGFRVANPAVEVTDLGGDVRIETDKTGGAEVVALDGTAEAAPHGRAEKLLLKSRQARHFANGNVMPVADLDKKLSRFALRTGLERNGRPVKFARWAQPKPELAEEESARLGAANPRTIALWVRVPTDAAPGEQAGIVGFGRRKFGNLRVAWNTSPEQGPLGALRTEHDGDTVVGHTSLRDGQWHHIAVMLVGNKKSGQFEIKQYVDGRLEGSGQIAWHKGGPAGSARDYVWVGRENQSVFAGDLDKLIFADRPLTPYELRTLIDTNTLPGGA